MTMSQSNQTALDHPALQSEEQQTSWLAACARRALFSILKRMQYGSLSVLDGTQRTAFGRAKPGEMSVEISVHDSAFYRLALLKGSLGAAEAYMRGYWSCEDLTQLIRLMIRNQAMISAMEARLARLGALPQRIYHRLRNNTRRGSHSNIAYHYDLGNDFFALFLDSSMSYSCGLFLQDSDTMEEASEQKNDGVCAQLGLGPGDHLLEIGSGWGALALHAARHYGCLVTTTTISRQQYEWTRRSVQDAGLADRIAVLFQDYRDLEGRFDKLVSIEMVEAVGHDYLNLYFKKCSQLLKPGGRMFIQAITIADRHFERSRRSVDFVQRYVFPGSELPSVSQMVRSISRGTNLEITHVQDITRHYPLTLRRWRKKFIRNLSQVRALGYGEDFIRMWRFYLRYCEAGFLERHIGDYQFTLLKPRY